MLCLQNVDLLAHMIDPYAVDSLVASTVAHGVYRLVLVESLDVLQEPDQEGGAWSSPTARESLGGFNELGEVRGVGRLD